MDWEEYLEIKMKYTESKIDILINSLEEINQTEIISTL
jgi:hypothetical protein